MRIFPFRYKLTLLIAGIVIPLLAAIFLVVQSYIEAEFREVVTRQLEQTERYVAEKLQDRHEALFALAVSLADEKLLRDVMTDLTLSRATRDDIVSTEVLPGLAAPPDVIVLDGNGKVVADNVEAPERVARTVEALEAAPWFETLSQGVGSAGNVYVDEAYRQVAALPAFIGEQMIGVVVVSRELTATDLALVKEASLADIAVLRGNKVVLSTLSVESRTPGPLAAAFSEWLEGGPEPSDPEAPAREVPLLGERFLVRLAGDPGGLVPPYAVVQSLDQRLAFLGQLELTTFAIGAIGIGIGVAFGFVLALAVSRPIQVLRLATREVERENLDHRVEIRTHDEFAQLGHSFNHMIAGLAEKRRIRTAFDKSVSPEVADHILRSDAHLGGQRRRASILFSDIREFSTLAEKMDPARLVELLNAYFTQVNECIHAHHGVTDKFIGDAVMAIFGAPIDRAEHASDALRAARDMLAGLDAFNRDVAAAYGCRFRIGVGINTGDVVAGLVGSKDRLAYTLVGDNVNLASRIEGLTRIYGADLILTESTWREIARNDPDLHAVVPVRELDRVRVKGRTLPVRIYEVLLRDESVQELVPQLGRFAEAREHLARRDFDGAAHYLEAILRVAPEDEGARVLLGRCRDYARDPARFAQDYDPEGVRVLTTK